MSGLITGKILLRDLGDQQQNKKLFLLMGQLWIPSNILIKPEHKYVVVGSEYTSDESELLTTVGLQILLNGEVDISHETKKKHPSQLVPLLRLNRS